MPEIPEEIDVPAVVSLLFKLCDHVATLGDVIVRHEQEIKAVRGQAVDALAEVAIARQSTETALAALTEQFDGLDHRVTTVHEHLLRTLNTRYAKKENA